MMKAKNGKNRDWPYWWDGFTKEELKGIARKNFHSFDDMKNALVSKRESLCSMEDIAKELGCTVDDVAAFEQYDSDPTISEVQEYALAVMSGTEIRLSDYRKSMEVKDDQED